nr:choice-of-anchor Q domain-containing protein [uncultured Arsenicibacter sp.]
MFGSLRQNTGGAVATHSIGDCSPAKDAGVTSSAAVTIPTTDANIKPRTGAPDAGAFEVQVPTSVSLTAGNSGTITCVNQVLTASLNGGTSGTYVFAGPGLSTTTTSTTAIASQAGTYTVTVTSAEGCTASATTSVFADTASPGVSLSVSNSGIITCSTQAVTLTAGSPTAGSSFSFTSPGGAVQTTNQLTVNTTGIYSVTARNPQNGCVSSTTAAVTSSTEVPGVSLTATNGGVLVCETQTLTLTAGSQTNGVSYSFTGTNPFTTSGNSIVVAATGQYSVSALNPATGCFSTTSLTVSENLIPPGPVSIDKSGAIGCGPNSVTLSANAAGAVSYTLLPSNQSSASGQFVVTSNGSYTVIAANGTGAGCQSSGTATVNQGVGAVAGPISMSGQPNAANPGRLAATGTGSRFVFTGPNGYVFSAVYRSSGVYNVIANGIIAPGVYTLTVYGTEGCPPAISSITVQ